MTNPEPGDVRLVRLVKRFADSVAVNGIDLHVHPGEFFALLGPSGCGKTTTLRMIAGFERPTSGNVLLDSEDVAGIPPHRRNVHTVFQNYALFPHMNVYDNVAFGLRRHHVAKRDCRTRVHETLELVELGPLARRRSHELSGGQQQRVALARAIVLRPAVLLLDEPLGALDAKIRVQLRSELKALQEKLGMTFIFVTHDQEEALSMSDKVAVMNNGQVEQVGTARAVYDWPATMFVADFLGVSNLMPVEIVDGNARSCWARLDSFTLQAQRGAIQTRGTAALTVRPERVELLANETRAQENCIRGMVERVVFRGSSQYIKVRLATGALIQAELPNKGETDIYSQGAYLAVRFPPDALHVVLPDSSGATSAPRGSAESLVDNRRPAKRG